MDNVQKFSEILKKSEVFSIEKIEETSVIFKYQEKNFFTIIFFCENYNYNEKMPLIVANNFYEDFPHILIEGVEVEGVEYRSICLYEGEKFIFSDLNFIQKVDFLLRSLKELLNLNKFEREEEFQKEFSHYWNSSASINFAPHIFFGCNSDLKKLKYYLKNGIYRVLTGEKKLNDISEWKKTKNVGFLVPILDKKGILPPTKEREWTIENLLYILQNPQISKISSNVYNQLKKIVIKSKKIDLFFLLPFVNGRNLIFGCRIAFKNSGSKLFFDKLISDVEKIDPFFSYREDFDYLNQAIGNITIKKKVAIVGCGSLGSYVASELVKAGVKNLVLIDEDIFSNENTFRHRLPHYMKGVKKTLGLKYSLEQIHPEIFVENISKKLDEKNIEAVILNNNVDVVIFCVGSTDEQRKLSKALISKGIDCAVLYSWLESNGEDSRTIGIPKGSIGCYNCLKEEVERVFPRLEETNKEVWLSDGCGGTRVKYGNRTLLTAANGLLESFEKVLVGELPFVISSNIVNGLSEVSLGVSGCDICGEIFEEISITK